MKPDMRKEIRLSQSNYYMLIGKLCAEHMTSVKLEFEDAPYEAMFTATHNFIDAWWIIQPAIAGKEDGKEFVVYTGANLSRKRGLRFRIRIGESAVPELDPQMFNKVAEAISGIPGKVFNFHMTHSIEGVDVKEFIRKLINALGFTDSDGYPNHTVIMVIIITIGLAKPSLCTAMKFVACSYLGYVAFLTPAGQKACAFARELFSAFMDATFQDEVSFLQYLRTHATFYDIQVAFGQLCSLETTNAKLWYPKGNTAASFMYSGGTNPTVMITFEVPFMRPPHTVWCISRKQAYIQPDEWLFDRCIPGSDGTVYSLYLPRCVPQFERLDGLTSLFSLVAGSILPMSSIYHGTGYAKAISNCTTIFGTLFSAVQWVSSQLVERFGTWDQVRSYTPYSVVNKFYSEFLPYRDYLYDPSSMRFREMEHVCSLYQGLRRYMSKIDQTTKMNRDVFFALSRLARELEPLYQRCMPAYSETRDIRCEPVGIYICGEPGKGKSLLTRLLIAKAAKVTLPPARYESFKARPTLEMWNYNPAEEHCTYSNQAFITMDDGFQAKAGTEMSQKTAMFLVAAINSSPYAVHSAGLEEKGNVFLRPDVVVCTSNVTCLTELRKDVSCYEAIVRRFPMSYYISVIPEVATSVSLDAHSSEPWRYRLDQRKLDAYMADKDELIDQNIWVLYPWDLENGRCCGPGLSVHDVLERFSTEHLTRLTKFEATLSMIRSLTYDTDDLIKDMSLSGISSRMSNIYNRFAYGNLDSFMRKTDDAFKEECYPWYKNVAIAVGASVLGCYVLNAAFSHFMSESGVVTKVKEPVKPKIKPKWFGKATAQLGSNHANLVTNLIRSNMYILTEKARKGSKIKFGYVTFLCGRFAMMPAHFYESMSINQEYYMARCGAPDTGFSFKLEDLGEPMALWEQNDTKPRDIVIIQFPRFCHEHAKITKYIAPYNEILKIMKNRASPISLVKVSDNRSVMIESGVCNYLEAQPYTNYGTYYEGITYNIATEQGDCGSPVFYFHGARPYLIAIHTAGRESLQGFGTLIYEVPEYSFVEWILKQCITAPTDFDNEAMATAQMGSNCLEIDRVPLINHNSSTCYRRSCLGRLDPPLWGRQATCAPARLRKSRDGRIDPWEIARSKYSPFHPYISGQLLYIVGHNVRARLIKSVIASDVTMRLLDFEECILGVSVLDIPSINRMTSPGYPYKLHCDGKPGKTAWLGTGQEFDLSTPKCIELKLEFEAMIAQLERGERLKSVYVDNLKDEFIALEKSRNGSTRLFSAANMSCILLQKRYFGTFVAMIKKFRGYNGCAYGINPFNCNEWSKVPRALKAGLHDLVVAGDFKRFDKSIPPSIMYAALDIIQWFYAEFDDTATSADTLARCVLFEDIVNSIHLDYSNNKESIIYEWYGSNPSGNYLTTVLNCLVNMIVISYANTVVLSKYVDENIYRAIGLLEGLNYIVFGDDALWRYIPQRCDIIFDQQYVDDVIQVMQCIGFKCVSPIGEEAVVLTPLENATFLQRSFTLIYNEWRAPLNLESIRESVLWEKTGGIEMRKNDFYLSVRDKCKEFALHGEAVWEAHVPELIRAFNRCMPEYKLDNIFEMDLAESFENDFEYLWF